jgi:hypothetical protein
MALFTTALGLYGGVLWSGELQGLIIHEAVPNEPCFFCPFAGAGARQKRPEGAPMPPQPLSQALLGRGLDFAPVRPLLC